MNLTKIIPLFLLFAGSLNYYSFASAGEFDGDFSLPPALLLELDKHMDMINHANTWVQGSVDTLNDLFMTNAGLPLADWKEYFRAYFETRYFSENLQYYIQHPTFWWLDDPTHDMLQKALISGLAHLQNRLLSSASTSLALSDSLYSNDSFGKSLMYIHFHLHRYFPSQDHITSIAKHETRLYSILRI